MRRRQIFACVIFVSVLLLLLAAPGISIAGQTSSQASPAASNASYADRYGIASSQLTDLGDDEMEAEFQALNGAGASWVRCGFSWINLEPVQGWWNPERLARADQLVAKAESHGVNVLGILGCTPYWANGGKPFNYPPTDIAAWRNYVRTIATRYKGRVKAWEIWNEEDIQVFWGNPPDPVAYMQILIPACEEIRAADPGATIVMGGLAACLDTSYLITCLQLGLANYVDAVAYHPYPETLGTGEYTPQEYKCRWIVNAMHYLFTFYGGRDLQLWITELGFSTAVLDQDTQAAYMLRSLINYAMTDVDRIFWYRLRDTTGSPPEESGLLKNDFTRKKAYKYYATFEDVFGSVSSYDSTVATFSSSRTDALEASCFRKSDGGLVIAAWTSDDLSDNLTLKINDSAFKTLVRVNPLNGERQAQATSFDAQGKLTASLAIGKEPVVLEARMGGNQFYFAEGYTGSGFEEWLCLANPNPTATVAHVTYMFEDGSTQAQEVPIGANTRQTVYVNEAVGPGKNVSIKITSDSPIVAERPMYFNYKGAWTGGHDVVGATSPQTSFCFAEGYTGSGFEEWLCLANPNPTATVAHVTYMFEDGSTQAQEVPIGANTRQTVYVNEAVGPGKNVSIKITSDSPIVAERPMYFNYKGAWTGGHDVVGATSPQTSFCFAEGYTGSGFEEWLCLANPNPTATVAHVTYMFEDGSTQAQEVPIGANTRQTVYVNEAVGPGKNVSIKITSDSPIVAERPMYFNYKGAWTGGHDVVGATSPQTSFCFAEGYTGSGFEEWLCLANPNPTATVAHVTYMFEDGSTQAQEVPIGANTRQTVYVNEAVGPGKNVSIKITSDSPIVAERPMYFNYKGAWTGGHDVVGYMGDL